jgi:hypothetical protein
MDQKPIDQKFYPSFLKVSVEGSGGTVYIVHETHDYRSNPQYLCSVGVGKDCIAKTTQEAIKIAQHLVNVYNLN